MRSRPRSPGSILDWQHIPVGVNESHVVGFGVEPGPVESQNPVALCDGQGHEKMRAFAVKVADAITQPGPGSLELLVEGCRAGTGAAPSAV